MKTHEDHLAVYLECRQAFSVAIGCVRPIAVCHFVARLRGGLRRRARVVRRKEITGGEAIMRAIATIVMTVALLAAFVGLLILQTVANACDADDTGYGD